MLPTATADPGQFFRDRRPIRSELLGPERLAARIRAVAAASKTVNYGRGRKLLDQGAADAKSLRTLHKRLAASHRPPPGEAEWLYDNFHIIDEALREIEVDLPPGYYVRLPQLADGPLRGLPRVYWLAAELIAHTDSALDQRTLEQTVRAFQTVVPLTIGELWAVPIMLRVVLIENLARLGEGVGATVDGLARAINQVTVSNAVTSLRLMSAIDWPVFYEATSVVHARLSADPAGVYALQDFATRDRYRQRVELLARDTGKDELAVCAALLDRAAADMPPVGTRPADVQPQSHIGYYLFGDGRTTFAKQLGYRATGAERRLDRIAARPRTAYFAAIGLLTAFMMGGAVWLGGWIGALVALPVLLELAIGFVNNTVTRVVPPQLRPKLDFSKGIPADCATFIVIPTLLTSAENNAALVERLEIHALSNPGANLHFALLTDWTDSPTETRPTDAAQVDATLAAIQRLNRSCAPGAPPKFFLFHRRRLWNPVQNCWMGWERKRGKLSEFNRLLLGATDTTYSVISCERDEIPKVRFVITLDSDTQLPRETAPRLIGTLAHPLNRPRYDPAARRVVAGYTILQPRVSISLPAARRSRFSRTLAGSAGIDPYTTATSDVYQDLFGLGTFTGKGIYDLHAFEAATGTTFPENHILSHDLIEGNYARCALVTDIDFVDDLPSRYNAFAKRDHRWVRGDWQLLPWLGRRVPVPPRGIHGPAGGSGREREWLPNPLPLVERWKVFDNLRRSLMPPALVLLLTCGWTVLPGSPWLWTFVAMTAVFFPLVLGLPDCARGMLRRSFWLAPGNDARAGTLATLGQGVLQLSFLFHQSASMLDAVVRTLYRLFVSGRRLLEWETAAATERRLGNTLVDFTRFMFIAPVGAVLIGAVVALIRPDALPAAAPVLLAWFASPALAYWVSMPAVSVDSVPTEPERRAMRRIARKTWAFFETFVTPDDHMLPPDNFQEHPNGVLARRTSPTNIGLCLLANLAARDFGTIGVRRLLERTGQTLATLAKLERHNGHFLNWYRTDTLAPLEPKFVSTVDSGNLLASLVTLRHGLAELLDAPLAGREWCDGITDTLALAEEALARPAVRSAPELRQRVAAVGVALASAPSPAWVDRLVTAASAIDLDALPEDDAVERWVGALVAQVRELRDEAAAGAGRVGEVPELRAAVERLDALAAKFIAEMDFRTLYNDSRHLFAIGYNLSEGRYSPEHYDLMASEACLTSFLCIARGEAHRRHWFMLGRPVAQAGDSIALVSWGGTMFEYLLPRLFLRTYPQTLLHLTRDNVVAAQIAYGRRRGVPWGISESGYYHFDADQLYQYMSFGVPGLGLKRGLENDLVVSPYSTVMAVMVRPREAVANFPALAAAGGEGPFGFYEAIDYTPPRVPAGMPNAVVRSYMAHHQAMGYLALANRLFGDPFPRRFHAEPAVRATELLLQERVPWDAPIHDIAETDATPTPESPTALDKPIVRRVSSPDVARPRTHLLSNGQYAVVLTNAGTGWSSFRGRDVTRRVKGGGTFVIVRDTTTGVTWSAGHFPTRKAADEYEAAFAIDKATLRRRDGRIETVLEVTVSPESPGEVRRVTVTNHDDRPLALELTSVLELANAPDAVQHWPASNAIAFRRDDGNWVVHAAAGDATFEGGSTAPAGLRLRITVPAASSASVAFLTAVAGSGDEAAELSDRFQQPNAVARTFELAWAHARTELCRLDISPAQFHLFQRLAGSVLIGPEAAPVDGKPTLAVISDSANGDLVEQVRTAQSFWSRAGVDIEIVSAQDSRSRVVLRASAGGIGEQLDRLEAGDGQ